MKFSSRSVWSIFALMVSFKSKGHCWSAACHVRCIEIPAFECHHIGCTSTSRKAPAKAHDPKLGTLEALANLGRFPRCRIQFYFPLVTYCRNLLESSPMTQIQFLNHLPCFLSRIWKMKYMFGHLINPKLSFIFKVLGVHGDAAASTCNWVMAKSKDAETMRVARGEPGKCLQSVHNKLSLLAPTRSLLSLRQLNGNIVNVCSCVEIELGAISMEAIADIYS